MIQRFYLHNHALYAFPPFLDHWRKQRTTHDTVRGVPRGPRSPVGRRQWCAPCRHDHCLLGLQCQVAIGLDFAIVGLRNESPRVCEVHVRGVVVFLLLLFPNGHVHRGREADQNNANHRHPELARLHSRSHRATLAELALSPDGAMMTILWLSLPVLRLYTPCPPNPAPPKDAAWRRPRVPAGVSAYRRP